MPDPIYLPFLLVLKEEVEVAEIRSLVEQIPEVQCSHIKFIGSSKLYAQIVVEMHNYTAIKELFALLMQAPFTSDIL